MFKGLILGLKIENSCFPIATNGSIVVGLDVKFKCRKWSISGLHGANKRGFILILRKTSCGGKNLNPLSCFGEHI